MEVRKNGLMEVNDQLRECVYSILDSGKGMSEDEKAEYLQKIRRKLESGEELTAKEMRFLRINEPELYQVAKRIQVRRKNFEEQMKQADSKEEVQKAYSRAVFSVSDKDPYQKEIYAAYQNAYKEFKATEEYRHLPEKEEEEKKGKHRNCLNVEDELMRLDILSLYPRFDVHS